MNRTGTTYKNYMSSIQIPPFEPWAISADGTIVWTGVLLNKLRVQIR